MSTVGINNIFGEGHIHKPEICGVYEALNILRLGIFNSFCLLYNTIKQLNKY